ncbi:TetR/AcrR family transcriptional regulator [Flavobacterium sp. ZT3R18]|nr:TetR/AcrR family transcriptional regulator [Flavobacterium sp. ZT3R18]
MKLHIQIKMNEELYLRNPESSELGKKIIQHSIELIYKSGFESFTFKKLAEGINSTEASIYRYFENKHRLLIYIVAWYWNWLKFQISFETNNIIDPTIRLKKIIKLLASTVEDDDMTIYINESLLHQIVISEGSKVYLTKHVGEDNKHHFFKPYKELCAMIGSVILEYNPAYKYPKSLATTIIEMAHFQNYFMVHLPLLTDFGESKNETEIIAFLEDLVFSSINKV